MSNEAAISEFRRVSKVHEDWLVHTLVGPDLLTKGELANLQLHGSLPLGPVLDLTTVSYYLGKKKAHLKSDAYKSLSYEDLTDSFTPLEKASISDLRIRAATEIRRIAQYVSSSTQAGLQSALTKGIKGAAGGEDLLACVQEQRQAAAESFSKAFTLFQNIHSLAMADLVHISKSQAQVNTMVQSEGIYTEGLGSSVMVEHSGKFTPVTAVDLMSKSLSGMTLHYVPPGAQYSEGRIEIVDSEKFKESLSKAVGTNVPTGPPQPKTPDSPGSIKGLAAPGNEPGPGRGNSADATNAPKAGVEYDDWRGSGEPRPPGEGWEQSTTGGWRHIKGSGGVQSPQDEPEDLVQKQQEAINYGRSPHTDEDVLKHLSQGTLVSIKKLGQTEAGVHNAFRVTTEGGGRGLMKPVEQQSAETHGDMAGTGMGSVPRNNSHGHETAAYQMYNMFGLKSCPPTTTRSFDGATHSIQAWAEDHVPTDIHTLGSEETNKTKALLEMVPSDKKEEFTESMMGMIAMDIVMNNNDGHRDNVLVNKDSTNIKSIDHSDAFGTGMKGIRNDFHHDFHRMGKKVTIPETLQTNLRGKSLGDYKRSMGGHIQDWQVGQTYLRAQYALHLQDTEGHLDYSKFLPTMDSFHGGNEFPMQGVRKNDSGETRMVVSPAWRVNNADNHDEFDKRKEEKTLPNDLFQSFAKKFINDNKDNPESAYHAAAKELDSMGVFMPPSAMADPKEYRRGGKQHQFARSIAGRNPDAEVGHRKNLASSQDLRELGEAATVLSQPKTVKKRRGTK